MKGGPFGLPLSKGMQRGKEGELKKASGTFPRTPEKGGREEADSGSDGIQEQIQEEGKWMGCLVHGFASLSHTGNDLVITEHSLKVWRTKSGDI